jgi:hypothetical protein
MNRTMQQSNAVQGHHHPQMSIKPKLRGNTSLDALSNPLGTDKKKPKRARAAHPLSTISIP